MKQAHYKRRLNQLPNKLWSLIAQIDECKGRWISGAELSPQVLGRLKRSVLVTSTGASTRIEGAKLSDAEIEKMMRGISIQTFQDRDHQEVQGYYELLNNIFSSWRRLKLSEGSIKHFHSELLKYVDKDKMHRGDYKKRENKVHMIDEAGQSIGVLFDTTPAYLTPKAMQELTEWTNEALSNEEFHPLLIIGNFLVEFLNIHPFQDGNGRLSRVLTNLLMLRSGYIYMPYVSHEKLIEDNKSEYYVALRKSQKMINTKSENIKPWLYFFLTVVLEQSKLAVALLSDANIEKLLSKKQLAIWEYLQQIEEATPKEIAEHAGVARPTVNQVIDKLLRLKKIERIGLGRGTRYRILHKT
ncbi:MAG: Fic family protein [Pseudomonadota bacterium]